MVIFIPKLLHCVAFIHFSLVRKSPFIPLMISITFFLSPSLDCTRICPVHPARTLRLLLVLSSPHPHIHDKPAKEHVPYERKDIYWEMDKSQLYSQSICWLKWNQFIWNKCSSGALVTLNTQYIWSTVCLTRIYVPQNIISKDINQ